MAKKVKIERRKQSNKELGKKEKYNCCDFFSGKVNRFKVLFEFVVCM